MLQGSLSETYRTCGYEGCRCHRGHPHGPHTYMTFKTPAGRSSALYVPAERVAEARGAVAAWKRFWELAVRIAEGNRESARRRWRKRPLGERRKRHAP